MQLLKNKYIYIINYKSIHCVGICTFRGGVCFFAEHRNGNTYTEKLFISFYTSQNNLDIITKSLKIKEEDLSIKLNDKIVLGQLEIGENVLIVASDHREELLRTGKHGDFTRIK